MIEFAWLQAYVGQFKFLANDQKDNFEIVLDEAPSIVDEKDQYSIFVVENKLDKYERLALMLALAPHLSHTFLQQLNIQGNPALLRQNTSSGALMPTGETYLYLASCGNENDKLDFHKILATTHAFYKKSILDLEEVDAHFPPSYGILKLSDSYRDLFLYNQFSKPRHNSGFPAHLLESNLEWSNLVLNEFTRKNLDEIRIFVNNEVKLRSLGNGRHMKPGYRVLFYGPSGTGKTLAVTLLGKELKRDVYRVDLSMVVSKYIGETSKNLNALFDTAENKGWILFFDEGDAVFAKRSEMGNGEDKNARSSNQETAFLLQRIESYNGLVIVATNYRQNMDQAFARRFQCMVSFGLPDVSNRLKLWKENVPPGVPLSNDISLEQIAGAHHLSGASILKIIQRASLQALGGNRNIITRDVLEFCIKDEEFNSKQTQ